jgi:hypothetical protein
MSGPDSWNLDASPVTLIRPLGQLLRRGLRVPHDTAVDAGVSQPDPPIKWNWSEKETKAITGTQNV